MGKQIIMCEEDYYYVGMADAVVKVREVLAMGLNVEEALQVVEDTIKKAQNVEPNEDTLGERGYDR